jgi:hypothetical protein
MVRRGYRKKEMGSMNRIELVKAAFNGDGPEQGFYLSDDFQWSDASGNAPLDKASFSAMARPLESAFPDLSVIIEDIREDGEDAVVASHYTGTFTNDLDLSAAGMGVIPATGEVIVFPTQRDRVSFDGTKISEIYNLGTGPDAGMAAVLKALGVEMG